MRKSCCRRLLGTCIGWTVLAGLATPADATIDGVTGTSFSLVAKADYISTADGNSVYTWGYGLAPASGAPTGAQLSYPGPTMIVNEGDTVTVTLTNTLDEPVSLVFPGQVGVTAAAVAGRSSAAGQLTLEASAPTTKIVNKVATTTYGAVQYSFVANHPGTFMYYSGSHQDLQTEMGLVGALIVRPHGYSASNQIAYGDPATRYDHEYLFLETDMDPEIHAAVDTSTTTPKSAGVDMSKRFANYWFFNGRNGPDTLQDNNVPWLPAQPYSTMPQMHPGETTLMRVIGGGLDVHPFHHHGNHAMMIARDGMLNQSAPGRGPDVAEANFTIQTSPGETYDALFQWTGDGLGWDPYARNPGECTSTSPAPTDCGKSIPVKLPNPITLTAGPHYSGSPYLGQLGQLPPGEGGFNVNGGNYFMWHSHTEKELTNYNVYPGGMMTFMVIQPSSVPIE